MDGTTAKAAIDVQARLAEIKAHMPMTYRAIQIKAAQPGSDAYRLVRLGIKGVPNSFYAIERGWVQGTPFDLPDVSAELARVIVQFGCTFLVMWAPGAQQGVTDGTH
jgi:hypothetical protein